MKRILASIGLSATILLTVFLGLTEGFYRMHVHQFYGYAGDYVPLTPSEKAANDSFAMFLVDMKAKEIAPCLGSYCRIWVWGDPECFSGTPVDFSDDGRAVAVEFWPSECVMVPLAAIHKVAPYSSSGSDLISQ